jgi:hypothetical protein
MKKLGILVMAAVAASLSAQVFNVDTFDVGNTTFTPTFNPSFESQQLDSSEVLSGERRTRFYNGPTSTASISDGQLNYNRSDNSSLILAYGSYGEPTEDRHLHLDLSGGLMVRVVVSEMSTPFSVDFGLYDFDQQGFNTVHQWGGGTIRFTEPGERVLLLDQLDWNVPNDLTDIAGVHLTMVRDPGLTGAFAFESITVSPIPEPSTYAAIFGVGLIGFAAYRRQRGKTAHQQG